MKELKFWEGEQVVYDNEGNEIGYKKCWYCSDGISTYFGATRAEAAAHFGVPVGDFD